jgi:hypothetical protein
MLMPQPCLPCHGHAGMHDLSKECGRGHSARACMAMALVGSDAETSWKFFTEASLTRPRKLRHQQRRLSFQCGGLLRSCAPQPPPSPSFCKGRIACVGPLDRLHRAGTPCEDFQQEAIEGATPCCTSACWPGLKIRRHCNPCHSSVDGPPGHCCYKQQSK